MSRNQNLRYVSPMQEAAIEYATRGWAVFPLHFVNEQAACSCGDPGCQSQGKHPLTSNGLKAATTDAATVLGYWGRFPNANIGIATGTTSNIAVLDIDGPVGEESLRNLESEHGALPVTLEQRTGKGRHLLFRHPGTPIKSRTAIGHPGSKLDSRGEGGYIVAAPSRHVSGNTYAWTDSSVELAEMPAWLIEIVNGRASLTSARVADTSDTESIVEGARNSTLASLGGTMRRKGMSAAAMEQALLAENEARCKPPLDPEEVRTIANSISRYEAANDVDALFQTLNDTGNAERFVDSFGDTYRFVVGQKRWLVWNGNRWAYDELDTVVESAKSVSRAIFLEAAQCRSVDGAKALAAHAKKSMQRQSIISMMELAKSHSRIAITPADLDADPMLLGVANGVLDLRTGQLLPVDRAHLILRYSPVAYDPDANCHNFLQFLNTISNGDHERIAYLRRVAGYCLTGQTVEQCLFFLYGKGGNGKSTFAGILSTLLGDYARQAPSDMLAHRNSNRSQTNDLARLKGARLLISAEVEEGSFLAETLVKELTGGDTIAARFLYGEFFEFRPTFKILMSGNHKPVVRGEDEGIWRRIRLVPFDITIPAESRDKNLMNKLQGELPGILKWAVEGVLEWQRVGLGTPIIVQQAVENYRSEMDIIGIWLDEHAMLHPDSSERAGRLYDSYYQWATVNGHHYLSSTAFGRKFSERPDIEKARDKDGFYYRGVSLKPVGARRCD